MKKNQGINQIYKTNKVYTNCLFIIGKDKIYQIQIFNNYTNYKVINIIEKQFTCFKNVI